MFNYKWNLSDLKTVKKNWLKVFSTFACWGGSTMWYKLAWYEVIWANDIDKEMAKVYKINHNPKYYFLESIADFRLRNNLPEELYNLDILDWSPPCSTFSLAWSREKAWKVKKKFREWQEEQILSDLFFDWIELVNKLKAKVSIAENVKWMIIWNAKLYTKRIIKELDKIWYDVQLFLLNWASMWLPQRRERVFFICSKKGLKFPKLKLYFNEEIVTYWDITCWSNVKDYKHIWNAYWKLWEICEVWKSLSSVHHKWSFFNWIKMSLNTPLPTLTAQRKSNLLHPVQKRCITDRELILWWSYPLDYNFLDVKPWYLIWMSVPPIMMANIAEQIYLQWFNRIK